MQGHGLYVSSGCSFVLFHINQFKGNWLVFYYLFMYFFYFGSVYLAAKIKCQQQQAWQK